MFSASHDEYDQEQQSSLKKARVLEYVTILYQASIIFLMFKVLGTSQAMKTAWIEDCLSLIPPVCFLVSSYVSAKNPTRNYPFGFHRIGSILFLCAALSLLVVGGYLVFDSGMKLYERHHPTIGMKEFFGRDMWLGWWMMIVLLWGTFPPILLGRLKMKHVKPLNDKILFTDAKMNKADWLTAVAAIGGILGIGFGFWWADAAAAIIISVDILHDGWRQTNDAVTGLMNRAPKDVDNGYSDLPQKVEAALNAFEWIEKAEVKLYESGNLIFGQGCAYVKSDDAVSADKIRMATKKALETDWRLQDFALTLCSKDRKDD